MKTAISIPDPVFQAAELFARHFGISRSELYTKAVEEYEGLKLSLSIF
ncbi:hypothetical protein Thini_4454 [Thiothrix nivea DSM 5205]|uniref:ChpI protein n=1 Tax=Thiothrix nivea (strain ATCC 35100 / DSM 5205 / JP2) TaxID=870187 RepID=A0A656HL12_THINJ|nr:hypothetical protein Thini_4454 [Thiothrix nivea DSM 5205]